MSLLYARVFTQTLKSSIAEDFTVRHVFEDLFKVCTYGEHGGIVDMTRESLAREFNIPLKEINRCIAILESPDPKSRNPAHEGRRLLRLDDHRDWGWRITNWKDYADIKSRADAAARVVRHREKSGLPLATKSYPPECTEILSHLSKESGTDFRNVDAHLSKIHARIREGGVTVEGIKKMVSRQCEKWRNDPKMREYMRPKTIFGRENFDNYYAARDQPVIAVDKSGKAPGKFSHAVSLTGGPTTW